MASNRKITSLVADWFGLHARALPWRRTVRGRRDPYVSLVSEIMLQQTQVSRVLERFDGFIDRFPTAQALADAPEEAVLGAWSGLGYYRRARSLQAAARVICEDHGGRVPRDLDDLIALPGVGRYTAGAICSIVFGQPVPIVDGNVVRVLARLDGIDGPPDHARSWARADELAQQAKTPALFNEGLMELGATVCTPRNPRCGDCPLKTHCKAHAACTQEQIPSPKPKSKRQVLHASSMVAIDGRGRVLVEQRPADGLWGGLWQVPTVERASKAVGLRELRDLFPCRSIGRVSAFRFDTTHREVRFVVYKAIGVRAGGGRQWMTRRGLSQLGVSNAQRRVLDAVGIELDSCVRSGT